MTTTDALLAARAVDALVRADFQLAFLHREIDAAAGDLKSDYDLVVEGRSAEDVMARAIASWCEQGLHPVLASQYDAGSVALWLSTADGDAGAQIDLTWDRQSVNQLALPLGQWLGEAAHGIRWNSVSPVHERAYVERKRALKGGSWQTPIRWPRFVAESRRIIDRLHRPAGFCVAVCGERHRDLVDDLHARFSTFLPRTQRLRDDTTPVAIAPSLLSCLRARLRPGLILAETSTPCSRCVDLELNAESRMDADEAAQRIVVSMTQRLWDWHVSCADWMSQRNE